jgi:hypothetical protein
MKKAETRYPRLGTESCVRCSSFLIARIKHENTYEEKLTVMF